MHHSLKESLWNQFGAGIDLLENAITVCPAELWDTGKKFWYNAYHCLFFLDYYLTMETETFAPPVPFTLSEFEDTMPERVYTKEEVLTCLQFCRNKCHDFIKGLTNEIAQHNWVNKSKKMDYPVVEILLYNLRHLQHHAAQLNLILRQEINEAPDWIFRARKGF